ncbi:type VII secretion-associated protein, Rv3446c family, C-terminal domain-containing protein [Amycolatopsis xylanica]|uniref:Type VII secretion-associated protein, Rv3446c family, C-terminal domain-containing protein n=1 Tax=Amycolatopsis xylanica TaxID=589385 RepID=A0A1H3LJY5_9PSEU|nr:type VII secretion-associated protein [Amycolatopsis xylanica]SDY64762.1 type VII secretion-associated protein, Rv3446c family, C-terminal domain-containing protein [Amycolatopsis xylanica]
MTLRVAVDFGTSSTCVVASVNGRDPQVVVIDGQPLMSSAVFAAADGTLFVGQEAERQAAVDPSRYEPNPKRRIDEGELLLGDSVLLVTDVVHAVLRRAVTEAKVLAGGADVSLLVLTHPADWGAIRTRLLRQAAGGLANEVALVPEPVAAAVFHAATFAPSDLQSERTVEFSGQPGQTIAVLDLGGGTVDVSVVRRAPSAGPAGRRGGFQVLATRGDPSFGGADIDQALLEHVGSLVSATDPQAWRQLVEGREMADRRRRRVLRQDVRGAKETLSRHAYTDVPMPPPFADAHVTREDLERLIAAPLGRAVELTRAAVDDAGLRPQQLSAIFLVGGSSRIPMISRLVHERTGVVPTTLDQPETVVARGALRAVLIDPDRTGALPGSAVSGGPSGPRQIDERTEIVRPGEPPRRPYPAAPQPAYSQVQAPPRPMPQQAPPVLQPSANWNQPAKPKRKLPWVIGGVVLLVAAAVATLLVVLNGGGEEGKQYAAYDYRFYAPADWVQTSDSVAKSQVVLRPGDLQNGDDLISVQEFKMTYDATADRQRLVTELRTMVENSSSHGEFAADKSFGGKTVIYYQETKAAARLDWYVATQGMRRVHVACQYAVESVRPRVQAACEQVVRTLVIG